MPIAEGSAKLEKIAGTQSIARAFAILRTLSRFGARGMPLRDIARANGLNPATTHRMLQELVRQGAIVQHDNSDYALGPLLGELSVATYSRDLIIAACHAAMHRLSEETEETVFLIMQSGSDGLCLDRVEGRGIVRVITLDVGERRPLTDSAGGIAMLAMLDDAEINAILALTRSSNARYSSDPETMWRSITDARRQGFALVRREEQGISALSMAVGAPGVRLAISLSSTSARLEDPRRSRIVPALETAVRSAEHGLIALPFAK